MLKTILAALLALVMLTAALVMAQAAPLDYLTILVSIAALVVSLMAAFKEDLFPFRPRCLLDAVTLAAPSRTDKLDPSLLLPIEFLNDGYGAGVIEGLTIKVQVNQSVMIYTPLIEVDYAKFIGGKRALHADNALGEFNIFPLGPRAVTKKAIVFRQEAESKRYPHSEWSAGEYTFSLYIKHSGSLVPVVAGQVKHSIPAKLLEDHRSGTSISIAPGRELHV